MAENNGSDSSGSIEDILRKRDELDGIIKDKFKKELSILFTDICGYTQFMDSRGDIEGRVLLQRHNDIVFSKIESNNGTVIKTIGDAVMASFLTALDAVKASIAIQAGLLEHNQRKETKDEIHVKIGINLGTALLDSGDIFGDAVNVAARIQSKAGEDEILISDTIYKEVRNSEDILCRHHGNVSVKGKPEPLNLFRVVWKEEEEGAEFEGTVRSPASQLKQELEVSKKPLKVLFLELSMEGEQMKVGIHERIRGEEKTIRQYEETPLSTSQIKERCSNIVGLLNSANREGRIGKDILIKLREMGKEFFEELFTPTVKMKIKDSDSEYMMLNLDDKLVQIPWELLNDGDHFLCQKFNIGRIVKTRQQTFGIRQRKLGHPLKMMVLADPEGNLKGAYSEGIRVRDAMDERADLVNVSFRTANITPDFIRGKIRNFDIVHFAGHAEYDLDNPNNSSWLLTDGRLETKDIMKMSGTGTMPGLIFSNACQSARTEEWVLNDHLEDEIFGLANAFLLTGAKHYIGTFWEILDEPSSLFALEFYKFLIDGIPIGEAMRLARTKLIEVYGEETIVWGSYVLYGDPTFSYTEEIQQEEEVQKEAPRAVLSQKEAEVRSREEVITFGEEKQTKPYLIWGSVASVALVILAILLWGYPGFLIKDTKEHERTALAHYQAGNYQEAIQTSEKIEGINPNIRLSHLILGNVRFVEGDLDKAHEYFRKALASKEGTDSQKAEALMGLGRIASLRNQGDDALNYYQKAAEFVPQKGQPYVSQAILLDRRGDFDQALPLYKKAAQVAPDDLSIKAITSEAVKKSSISKDETKRKKIDKLVKELLDNYDKSISSPLSDGWTSLPLTLWVMDFKIQGHSLTEGKEQLIASCIVDQLIENSHSQIVERSILDKVLEELKLGTSKLVDRSAALSLGRMLAARLILSGQVVHSGPKTQISIRFIETETGQVTASINDEFQNTLPPAGIAEALSRKILAKIKSLYPLRGKISEVEGNKITLNIGQKQGVETGQQFRVFETDVILETIRTAPEVSTTQSKQGAGILKVGLRVEAL